MRTLVYRRTHPHDPDERGCFGVEDCMGGVRSWEFDAVIGIGGDGPEARGHKINGKVNWIGVGARKHDAPRGHRGPLVTFDHFILFESAGPDFRKLAPNLAKRIYSTQGRCSFMRFDDKEQAEVSRILKLVASEPASTWGVDDLSAVWSICHRDFAIDCSKRRRSSGKRVRVKC